MDPNPDKRNVDKTGILTKGEPFIVADKDYKTKGDAKQFDTKLNPNWEN